MATSVRFDLIGRDRASGAFDRVGRKMTALEKLSGKVGTAMKVGLMAGATAVAGIGAVSVKSAVDFQSSMMKISTQAGATRQDVKTLSEQVLKLGGTVQQGPQQLSEALYHLKSVGMDNVDAMKALKTASDLAAVGHADLEATTNALAGAWRTGIKGATSFGKAAATVNSIIGAGNMTMEQFTEALASGILPTAKTFGLSLTQVGAALALFTDEGVPAADAATRLRMSISLLGAPSGAAEKQLHKIHLTGLQLANAMRSKDGLIGAIQLLKDHLDASGLSAAQQSQILSRAFGGGRSSAGILSMISNLDVMKKKQDQVNGSTGKYADAVKAQRRTAEAQWKRLKSALETGSVRLGTALLPPLTNFVGYINNKVVPAAEKIGSHLGDFIPMGKLKAEFSSAESVVGDFLKGLTGISDMPSVKVPTPVLKGPEIPKGMMPGESDARKFGETIRKVGTHLAQELKPLATAALGISKAFGTIVMKTPAPVFQTIVDVMIATAITQKIIGLGTAFKGLAVAMSESWVAATGPIGLMVGGAIAIATAFGTLSGKTKGVTDSIVYFGQAVGYAVGGIWDALKWVFSPSGGLADAIKSFNGWIAGIGGDIVHGIAQGAKSAWHATAHWFTSTLPHQMLNWLEQGFGIASPSKLMMPVGSNIIRGILVGALNVAKGIGGWLMNHVKSPVLKFFSGAGGWLYGKGSSVVSGFLSGLWSVAKGIGGWFSKHVHSPISGSFSGAGRWLYGAGGSLISGLVAGTWSWLAKKGHDFTSWAGRIKKSIVSAVVDVFKIGSPSKVMMEYGGWIMAGLQHGMLQGHDALKTVAKSVFKSPLDAAEAVLKNGGKVGEKWLAKLGGALGLGDSSAVGSAQQFAQLAMKSYGWGPAEWPALKALWQRESGWRWWARNPSSGAYGIVQALPPEKMASAGPDWRTNPNTQIRWGLSYIKSRYGSPTAAWAHETNIGWYAKGSGGAAPGWAWVGERGPELINLRGGETILSNPQSMKVAQAAGIKLPGYASGTIMNAADRVSRDKKKVEDAKDALADAKRRKKGVAAAEKKLEAAKKELKAAEISLANAKRSAKTSIANTIATGLVKTLSTGTSSAIASAIKSLATKLLNAGYTGTAHGVMQKGVQLERLADRRDSIQKRIAEASQYAADQAGNVKDFLSISGTSALSVGGLIAQMTHQQKTASSFVGLTKSLKKQGASKELLAQLAEAGPGSQLAAILSQKGLTAADIKKLNQLTASGSKLATNFGKDMADMMFDSGKDAGKGFLSGLKSQEKALAKQMAKLATDLVAQIKKALKIKSPSLVFRDEVGKNVVLGMVHGIDMHSHLVGAAAQRLGDITASAGRRAAIRAAVRARPTAALAFGGGDGTPQVTNVTKNVTINLHGAKQSSAEQAMDVARHLAHVG
ncbi:phage tail tape measure protein [Streptomyces sp. NPDC002676]